MGAADTSILQFSATSNGNVTPAVTVPLPTGYYGQALATDSTGQIYVAAYNQAGSDVILVYSASPTAAAQPARTFTTIDGLANSIAIDSAGLVYVNGSISSSNTDVIDVYAANASGAATPVRSIGGPLTNISGVFDNGDIAVGPTGTIYVTNYIGSSPNQDLLVFSSTANGNVAPQSTVLPSQGNGFSNVAVEPNGNVAVVAAPDPTPQGLTVYSIEEFSPFASGAAVPINSITSSLPADASPEVLAVDRAGNLYVSILTNVPLMNEFTVAMTGFTSTASGSATPFVTFTSPVLNGTTDFGGVIAVY